MLYTLFNSPQLQIQVNQYCQNVEQILSGLGIQELVIGHPIDHLAVKLANSNDYELYIESLKEYCETISYTEMHGRRLATATLIDPINLHLFNEESSCRILEIIEPKPDKANKGLVGFEHIEVFQDDLDQAKESLHSKGVAFEDYENPHHKAAVLVINDQGQEIKFTDSRLELLVEQQIMDGSSVVVK
jgi:predicted metalloenzyme YecM